MEKTFQCTTEQNMPKVAEYLTDCILSLQAFCVVLFFGDMGMGKTSLIRLTLENMGVEETVNSPTFAIMNEYHTKSIPNKASIPRQKFFHYDLFRLNHPSELEELGIEEIWCKEGHSFIEWADKFPIEFPYPQIQVHLEMPELNSRTIKVMTFKSSGNEIV